MSLIKLLLLMLILRCFLFICFLKKKDQFNSLSELKMVRTELKKTLAIF